GAAAGFGSEPLGLFRSEQLKHDLENYHLLPHPSEGWSAFVARNIAMSPAGAADALMRSAGGAVGGIGGLYGGLVEEFGGSEVESRRAEGDISNLAQMALIALGMKPHGVPLESGRAFARVGSFGTIE